MGKMSPESPLKPSRVRPEEHATCSRNDLSSIPADPTERIEGLPQLRMRRRTLAGLPSIRLPHGFTLRTEKEGDCEAWLAIISDSFGKPFSAEEYRKSIHEYRGYAPERLFFIEDENGYPCATAAGFGEGAEGYLHYVGVLRSRWGKRLGLWVSLAALYAMRERGCQSVILETDDFRLPAIRTYRRLGFIPLHQHWSHPLRWHRVRHKLGTSR